MCSESSLLITEWSGTGYVTGGCIRMDIPKEGGNEAGCH